MDTDLDDFGKEQANAVADYFAGATECRGICREATAGVLRLRDEAAEDDAGFHTV